MSEGGIMELFVSALESDEAKILAIDPERRRVTHVISTGRLDRGNRMIEQAGWKLGNFKRAPRVLADHDHSIERVIGKAIDTKVEGDRLISTTEFDEEGIGAVAFRLVQNGLVNTWSVGWIGTNFHRIGEVSDCHRCAAVKSKVNWGTHYVEQELIEYSLVAVPANPDAVMGLEAAGLVSESDVRQWIEACAPFFERSPAFTAHLEGIARSESLRAAAKRVHHTLNRPVR